MSQCNSSFPLGALILLLCKYQWTSQHMSSHRFVIVHLLPLILSSTLWIIVFCELFPSLFWIFHHFFLTKVILLTCAHFEPSSLLQEWTSLVTRCHIPRSLAQQGYFGCNWINEYVLVILHHGMYPPWPTFLLWDYFLFFCSVSPQII